MKKCFLCGEEKQKTTIGRDTTSIIYGVSCENCGKYKITDVLLKVITQDQKQAVIWFIKNNPEELISAENIEYIEQEYNKHKQTNLG